MHPDRSLLSPDIIENPYPYLHRLRSEDPVHWSHHHRSWLITRYADVQAAFRDPRLSSERVSSLLPQEPSPEDSVAFTAIERFIGTWMVFRDPPAHARLRRLARAAFNVRRIENLRADIRQIVTALIDRLEARRSGDLVRDFAAPLPAIVIARLLGVPEPDLERFSEWSHELEPLIFGGLTPAERRERAVRSLTSLERYFVDLLGHYRRSPSDNLLTALGRAEEQGDALTTDEVVGTCVLLLFAGHETTTNLIANGFVALDENPAARERLRRNPDLVVSAVEELLRFDGPTKMQVRVAMEDLEMRGRAIRAGQRVFIVQAAANRDPERFVSPDDLDLTRQDNDHVAFGYGIHHCLGAPLARLEAQIVFAELFRRLPTLRVAAPGPRWRETAAGRGMTHLPVELSAVPSEAARA